MLLIVLPGLAASNDSDASAVTTPNTDAASSVPADEALPEGSGAVSDRIKAERREAFNPYVLTAHKHNFVLPVSYSSSVNTGVYEQNEIPLSNGLLPEEVKFQISLKTQLNENDLLFKNDSLFLGITLEAWWQLYSNDLSSPFRETNYQPELFYMKPMLWGPFGGSTTLAFGLEHQSNGKVQGLSRSWNRLYTMLVFEHGSYVFSIKPWYRLPEQEKESPQDPKGDDNPDILDFMGNGEVGISWRDEKYEVAFHGRLNPSTGKGAMDLGVTFPLFAKFRGFVEYFNGYGDSLIDYNHFQQRIGLGVALSNLF